MDVTVKKENAKVKLMREGRNAALLYNSGYLCGVFMMYRRTEIVCRSKF